MLESRFVTIIIVEDDPGHSRLIEKNLRRGGLENPIKVFQNGQLALDYLTGQGDAAGHPHNQCSLLLLDINMPVMNGVELLRILKQGTKLRDVPVIMLTSTDDQREIDECYSLGCNLYVPKPIDSDRFSEIMCELGGIIMRAAIPSIKTPPLSP